MAGRGDRGLRARHEADPVSATDLYRIALRRLRTIRDDLEHGDSSERDLFQPDTSERAVQNWLANRLTLLSHGRYTVHCEEEVDRRKRPDIRLHNPAFAGPVCIEVKCANDSWSFADLENTLEHQLVGQYLRDRRSRHGIFVLIHIGAKSEWRPDDGTPELDFPGLLRRLEARAAALEHDHPSVDRLNVIGIDATVEPQPPPRRRGRSKKPIQT